MFSRTSAMVSTLLARHSVRIRRARLLFLVVPLANRVGAPSGPADWRVTGWCPGYKPHSRARRTTKWCQRVGRTGAPGRRRGNGGVKKADGRRKATGRPASPDHRGCLSPSGLRRRADSGGEVRRPAGSPRCARPLAFGLRADEGCRCGGTDAGGWRCSTRGTCAADGGGAVR